MAQYKLKWFFHDKKQAIKAVGLFGAKSIDSIKFYKEKRLFEEKSYHNLLGVVADSKAKKDLKNFFKESDGSYFVEFVRN
jgi:hypothetical protein